MSDDSIPVAVIGLGYFGKRMLDALREIDGAEVVAVSDVDRHVAESVGAETGLPYYSDNRQMILQRSPAAVFVSTPPMPVAGIMQFCASKGIAVWREAPLARNLEEAVSFVRMFDAAGLPLAVGSQRRFMDTYRMARDLKSRLGTVFLSRAHYVFDWSGPLGWRGDTVSAGGGALLELGFHVIDILVWTLGVPEEVYGVATCSRNPEAVTVSRPGHDTDDIASATWRYRDDSVASIVTSRISGPCSEEVVLCGGAGSVTADTESCLFRNTAGELKEHFHQSITPVNLFRRQAACFIRAVGDGAKRYPSPAAESLLAHAVIDSMYLSCRTSQPENPRRQLQIYGVEPEECFAHSPLEEDGSS